MCVCVHSCTYMYLHLISFSCVARELSQDTDGSRSRLSHRLGLVDDLTTMPHMVMDDNLTKETYDQVKTYLDKVLSINVYPKFM